MAKKKIIVECMGYPMDIVEVNELSTPEETLKDLVCNKGYPTSISVMSVDLFELISGKKFDEKAMLKAIAEANTARH